jgi:hypothetical protein
MGHGTRLFTEDGQTPELQLVDSKALSSGVVILTYKPTSTSAG